MGNPLHLVYIAIWKLFADYHETLIKPEFLIPHVNQLLIIWISPEQNAQLVLFAWRSIGRKQIFHVHNHVGARMVQNCPDHIVRCIWWIAVRPHV